MDKAKALIFGMGITGQNLYKELMSNSGEKYDVIGFVDNFLYHKSKNDKSKDNEKMVVYEPKELKFIDFDVIFIATLSGFYDVISQLKELGIPEYKMDKTYVLLSVVGRENFLKNFKILVV